MIAFAAVADAAIERRVDLAFFSEIDLLADEKRPRPANRRIKFRTVGGQQRHHRGRGVVIRQALFVVNRAVRLRALRNEVKTLIDELRRICLISPARLAHERRQRQRCDRRMIGGGPEAVRVLFGLKPGEAFVDSALDFVAKRNVKWRNLQRSWLFSGERIREAANRQRKPDEMTNDE